MWRYLPAMMICDSALSRQNTHQWFDTITNDRVYEPLARSDDYPVFSPSKIQGMMGGRGLGGAYNHIRAFEYTSLPH